MVYRVDHYINGESYENKSNSLSPLYNPATAEIIGNVAIGNKEDVEKAVSVAKNAFHSWSKTPPVKRAQILFKFRSLLLENKDELAKIVMREHGKTLADAAGSIQRGIDVVEFACGIPNHLQTSHSKDIATDIDGYSLRQPLGVCVGITPFNFPAMIGLWMFPLAIACGNTFVLKPSEKDPSVSLRIAELFYQAGLPKGVLNIVQGEKEVVNALLMHSDVKTVSFVGSTKVAEYIYKTATSQGKRCQAFGGAKNHALVIPDADIDQTVEAISGAAFGSAGERCMAISVVVCVGQKTADLFVEKLIPRINQLKIGAGDKKETEMGPLITNVHLEKVKSYIDIGVKEGATLIVDGRLAISKNEKGFYLGASLFDHVKPSMQIYKEEIFGPVLSIVRVDTFEDALELVNSHEYGNGCAIFTRDGYAARTFAHQAQIGMVGINVPIPVPVSHFSFGGWKHSLFGDLHMHGQEGVLFFTRLKTVTERWLIDNNEKSFAMPTMK